MAYAKGAEVISPNNPESLEQFFAFARDLEAKIPADFLESEERQTPPQDHDPLADYDQK